MAAAGDLPAVLMLGCSGGGKSSIVSHWKMLCAEGTRSNKQKDAKRRDSNKYQFNVTPNSGYERDTLQYGGRSFVVMEVGGGMKGNWSSYFTKCQAVIYVLDKANRRQLAAVAFDLVTLLTHPKLARTPVLFVLNKCDLPNAVTRTELQALIRFDDVLASAPQLAHLFPRNPPQLMRIPAANAAVGGTGTGGSPTKDAGGDGTGSGIGTVGGGGGGPLGPHHQHTRTSSWSPQSVAWLLTNSSGGPPGGYYRLIPPVPPTATVSQALPYHTLSVTIAPASTGSAIQAAHAAAKVTGGTGNVAAAQQPLLGAAGLFPYATPARNSGANNTFTGSALPPPSSAAFGAGAFTPVSPTVAGLTGAGAALPGTLSLSANKQLDFKHAPGTGAGGAAGDPTAGGVLPGAKPVSVSGPEPKSPKGKRPGSLDWNGGGGGGGGAGGAGTATVGGVTGPAKAMLKLPTGSYAGPTLPTILSPTAAASSAAAKHAFASAKSSAGAGGSPMVATMHPQPSVSQLNGPISARDTIPLAPAGPVAPPSLPVFETSAVTRAGVAPLLEYVALLLHQLPPAPPPNAGGGAHPHGAAGGGAHGHGHALASPSLHPMSGRFHESPGKK